MLSVFIKELKYLTSPAKNSCHNETRILPIVHTNAMTRRQQQVSVVGFEALTAAAVNSTIAFWNVAPFGMVETSEHIYQAIKPRIAEVGIFHVVGFFFQTFEYFYAFFRPTAGSELIELSQDTSISKEPLASTFRVQEVS